MCSGVFASRVFPVLLFFIDLDLVLALDRALSLEPALLLFPQVILLKLIRMSRDPRAILECKHMRLHGSQKSFIAGGSWLPPQPQASARGIFSFPV
jgi:hypothetical protein